MHRLRIALAIAFTVALVAAPSAATAAPVSAAIAAPMAPPPDFDPSSSKWRQYMLTVTGKVLGAAMPSKWKAEQIANEYALRYSPDALAKATGIGAGNPLDRIPETIEDYYAQEYERQTKRGIVAKNRNGAVPATAAKGFVKALGTVGAVFTAFEVGTFLGASGSTLLGGWFGYNANDLVCSAAYGTPGAFLTEWVSGQDCGAFNLAADYEVNKDADTTYAPVSHNGYTVTRTGQVIIFQGTYTCLSRGSTTPPSSSVLALDIKNANTGAWESYAVNFNSWSSCTQGSGIRNGFINYGGMRLRNPTTNEVYATSLPVKDNPDRRLDCTVKYTDGTSTTTQGVVYKETAGAVQPPKCNENPAKVPSEVEITEVQPSTPGSTPQKVYDEPTTPEFQEYRQDYPECAAQLCLLDLAKKVDGSVVSCFDLANGCPGWFEDPAKSDTYQCVYAAEPVDLSECNVYAGLFTPQRVEIGSPYTDPETGTWSGGQSAPRSSDKAMAKTIQDPELLRSCDFSGLGFDPVGWVLRPIQCAFEWAFIPRASVVELAFATAHEQGWEGKPPAVIAEAVGNFSMAPGASGCKISTTLFGTTTDVVNFCDGPLAIVPTLSRMITTAMFALMVFHVVRQQIAGMVGYNRGQG